MRDPNPMTADEVVGVLEGPPRGGTLEIGQGLADRLSRRYLDQFIRITGQHIDEHHVSSESPARVAVLNACIDEAAAAIHLAARCFYPQAIAHIRSIIEHRDLAILFRRQPTWAALWVDHDNPKRWRELSPAAVREKIGLARHDPVYQALSEHGVHATVKIALENMKGIDAGQTATAHAEGQRRARFQLQFAGTFNFAAGVRCAIALVYSTGAAMAEAQQGCGFCASERARRRFARDHARDLNQLLERHLQPLSMAYAAQTEDAAAMKAALSAAAKEYLSSAGPGE